MNISNPGSTALRLNWQWPVSMPALLVVGLVSLLSQGCTHQPQGFASPEEAVQALATAVRADDVRKLRGIFGSEGDEVLSSGDEVADRQVRQKFLTLYDEKHAIVDEGDGKTLVLGKLDWPFPIPLVKEQDKWFFDCDAGKEEILNRRIGRNELSTIQVCRAIGDAQNEYALLDPNNDGVHEYAQKFMSTKGKKDGLYWPAAEGEKPSPLGELVVEATGEGYVAKEGRPIPYHGYYYRILKEQGPHAPNGALNYVVNGKMMLGFAVLAYPADYDNSGIMTFIMGPDGVVYQKDLGEQTEKIASQMKVFDPGEGWKKVE